MNECLGSRLAFGSLFNHFQYAADGTFACLSHNIESHNAIRCNHSCHDFLIRFYQSWHWFACKGGGVKRCRSLQQTSIEGHTLTWLHLNNSPYLYWFWLFFAAICQACKVRSKGKKTLYVVACTVNSLVLQPFAYAIEQHNGYGFGIFS